MRVPAQPRPIHRPTSEPQDEAPPVALAVSAASYGLAAQVGVAPPEAVAAMLPPYLRSPRLLPIQTGAKGVPPAGCPALPSCLTEALRRPLVSLDLETTGLDVDTAHVVQLGLVKLHPHGSIETVRTLIQPWPPVVIPKITTAIHGIDRDTLCEARAPRLAQVASHLLAFVADCDLTGYNVLGFDIPLLKNALAREGWQWRAEDSHVADAQRLFMHAYPAEGRKLDGALRLLCGRSQKTPHDAADDAYDALEVLGKSLDNHPELPRDMAALDKLSRAVPRAYPATLEAAPPLDLTWWTGTALDFEPPGGPVRLNARSGPELVRE